MAFKFSKFPSGNIDLYQCCGKYERNRFSTLASLAENTTWMSVVSILLFLDFQQCLLLPLWILFSWLGCYCYNQFHIFWDFSMFYQFFLSPQVKRCAIITYKHGICELLTSCRKTYDFSKLGNQEISGSYLNFTEW